jgi:phospholipid/cholesterol/gamma-HCH transport system substrate-binding protein
MSAPGSGKVKGRIAGLIFFLVIALFITMSILIFNKVFRDVKYITAYTDDLGNALASDADVKVRDIIIGQVRDYAPEDGRVALKLAINSSEFGMIPANATVRLMPKTLFGERYVEVVLPEDPEGPIQPGGILLQDPAGNTVDAAKMYDTFYSLLEAVPPQDLAITLGALNQAFSGRGDKLGAMIERFTTMVTEYNRELPNLERTVQDFATFADTYSDAAPALVSALEDFRTTNRTIIEDRSVIDVMLESIRVAAGETAGFLNINGERLVGISADLRETSEMLARYSPSFPCTFRDFARHLELVKIVISKDRPTPGLNLTAEIANPRGRYLPNQDEPRMFDTRGPICYTDVVRPLVPFPQYPGGSPNDGAYAVPSRNPGPRDIPQLPDPLASTVPVAPTVDLSGTQMERDTVAAIYAQANGVEPEHIPGWVTSVGAPAFRGAEVSVE